MKLFLDTADVKTVLDRIDTGLIAGVTTNPTLIKKSGRRPEDVYSELLDGGVKDISMEIVAENKEAFLHEALRLDDLFGDVVTIKLPCSKDGLWACKRLTDRKIRVNITLVFSVSQAILASLAGATYVSPFVGRMDDNSLSGLSLINDINKVYFTDSYMNNTQILAASIRDVQSVSKAFELGASICTIPVKVFDNMYKHVLTDVGLQQFNTDWISLNRDNLRTGR